MNRRGDWGMEQAIYEHYGIKPERQVKQSIYESFMARGILYTIVPVQMEHEEILELKLLADYMIQKGDYYVASFVQTQKGTLIMDMKGQPVVLLQHPFKRYAKSFNLGKELAKFHQKGRMFPYPLLKCNRIGQWKSLWEKRLDQMEEFWRNKIFSRPENAFEKLFVESFTYYLGLAENAIQYLADSVMDEYPYPVDSATICHRRFSKDTWKQDAYLKLPTDWLFDHPSRDLAEWTRSQYVELRRTDIGIIQGLYRQYERITPLSPFSWRLLFARLLFPIHYFECIEGYYLTQSDEKREQFKQKLQTILKDSSNYERFLAEFHHLALYRSKKLPKPHWLRG
jgi:spore coat protein YutH